MWLSRIDYLDLLQSKHQLDTKCAMLEEKIRSLELQASRWEQLWQKAEKRADNAVDELLAVRGIPPVSVPSPQPDPEVRSPFTEDPDERARILKQYESLGPEVLVQEATQ